MSQFLENDLTLLAKNAKMKEPNILSIILTKYIDIMFAHVVFLLNRRSTAVEKQKQVDRQRPM